MKSEEIIKALKEIGFTQMNPESRPGKLNFKGYPIEVRDGDTLTSILNKVFKAGQTLKVWEIKGVLEIIS